MNELKKIQKKLMNSSIFLYFVLIIAIVNIVILMQLKYYIYVFLFLLLTLISHSCFKSKNMIITLLVPIILVNLLLFIRDQLTNNNNFYKVIEGNEDSESEDEED
tara:strand:+ start:324 stop:638 length:315 start_codon:yes stop_codon:yes gene_type:complete